MATPIDPDSHDSDSHPPAAFNAGSPPGLVLFLSGDLIFASRVRAAAMAAGLEFQLAGNLPEQSAHPVRFVIVDLSTRSKFVDGLMQTCHERFPYARVVAYAPHVQVDRLRLARQNGIPTVLTRGQFNEHLSTLLD
ncbi:histidine kinase [Aporhodopirellula aestuarii]|uniref:Histidine kinase n=1 Tax=Aporhodopirellula aestuarii TaxID=2950107 RepID=A0ABT0U0J2_9BACT|nr:histidine kinase [Aporhodopirellula aestuarii]MCM2370355.1 histidine kinase [Aporhodopirellula aestuarii]